MKFPEDFTAGEGISMGIATFFKDVFMQIKLAEASKIFKARDQQTVLETVHLISALFESNDFELFDNLLKVALVDPGVHPSAAAG